MVASTRTPRILEQKITLDDYDGPTRQLAIAELGHEDPTLLLTNQLRRSARKLIGRYAQRMDALSSAVAMKVDYDLQRTLMASSLYCSGPQK